MGFSESCGPMEAWIQWAYCPAHMGPGFNSSRTSKKGICALVFSEFCILQEDFLGFTARNSLKVPGYNEGHGLNSTGIMWLVFGSLLNQ